jgi:hypothetical protein
MHSILPSTRRRGDKPHCFAAPNRPRAEAGQFFIFPEFRPIPEYYAETGKLLQPGRIFRSTKASRRATIKQNEWKEWEDAQIIYFSEKNGTFAAACPSGFVPLPESGVLRRSAAVFLRRFLAVEVCFSV